MSEEQGTGNTAEQELESFRRQWQEEVKRGKGKKTDSTSQDQRQTSGPRQGIGRIGQKPALTRPAKSESRPQPDDDNGLEGTVYGRPENKEDALKLGASFEDRQRVVAPAEPQTALEHYEKAVEREVVGSLGDSVAHYSRAFKLDPDVDKVYKKKHFPGPPKSAAHPPAKPNPSNASATVPNTAHHSLTDQAGEEAPAAPANITELLDSFSGLAITAAEPVIEGTPPPPCPIADLPSELLLRILHHAADTDVVTLPRLSQVCRKLAHLVTTEDSLWKPIALSPLTGIRGMHYRYTLTIPPPLCSLTELDSDAILDPATRIADLTPSIYPTYRAQFRRRPRIRFGGFYGSVNNYTRPGVAPSDRRTWASPVHIVTYYRYIRFYRDGSCITLQTAAEPADVVPYLTKEQALEEKSRKRERDRHGPSAVMREALLGRWRLTGPASGPSPKLEDESEVLGKRPGEYAKEPLSVFDGSLANDEEPVEEEGTVHIETEWQVQEKYLCTMELALGSSGRKEGPRNNRLAWKGFWSYDRLRDDWAEFPLKHDKSLVWSRVKSWGLGE